MRFLSARLPLTFLQRVAPERPLVEAGNLIDLGRVLPTPPRTI